jgi:glycosyltransferase involved in cell wall biosynthesis
MLDEHIRETVESVFSQTYPRLEVMVVNDGSFRQQDQQVLDDLASRYPLAFYTEQNSGLGRARNFGISQSRGKYILPLDPDDLIEPLYIERCIDVLERRPELAYVNCWSRYIDEEGQPFGPPSDGYRPFTNLGEALPDLNVAGGASAVIRRHVFDSGVWYSVDATSYEDWLFYQELAAKGFVGHTIPEQLFVYRVRLKSMFRQVAEPHHERLMAEMATHRREWEVQWTS